MQPESVWNHLKYPIPEFVDEIKKSIYEREKLIIEAEQLQKRLRTAQDFFSGNHSPELFAKGIKQLRELVNELIKIHEQISSIDVKIISILEARLTSIAFKFKLPRRLNELGEEAESQEIYVVPWRTVESENRIEVTPEDIWLFRIAQKVFGFSANNIEFLDSDRLESIFKFEEK